MQSYGLKRSRTILLRQNWSQEVMLLALGHTSDNWQEWELEQKVGPTPKPTLPSSLWTYFLFNNTNAVSGLMLSLDGC